MDSLRVPREARASELVFAGLGVAAQSRRQFFGNLCFASWAFVVLPSLAIPLLFVKEVLVFPDGFNNPILDIGGAPVANLHLPIPAASGEMGELARLVVADSSARGYCGYQHLLIVG